jgi:hypothetical protein
VFYKHLKQDQGIKDFATKPDDLGLIPRPLPHEGEGEGGGGEKKKNELLKVVL